MHTYVFLAMGGMILRPHFFGLISRIPFHVAIKRSPCYYCCSNATVVTFF